MLSMHKGAWDTLFPTHLRFFFTKIHGAHGLLASREHIWNVAHPMNSSIFYIFLILNFPIRIKLLLIYKKIILSIDFCYL